MALRHRLHQGPIGQKGSKKLLSLMQGFGVNLEECGFRGTPGHNMKRACLYWAPSQRTIRVVDREVKLSIPGTNRYSKATIDEGDVDSTKDKVYENCSKKTCTTKGQQKSSPTTNLEGTTGLLLSIFLAGLIAIGLLLSGSIIGPIRTSHITPHLSSIPRHDQTLISTPNPHVGNLGIKHILKHFIRQGHHFDPG